MDFLKTWYRSIASKPLEFVIGFFNFFVSVITVGGVLFKVSLVTQTDSQPSKYALGVIFALALILSAYALLYSKYKKRYERELEAHRREAEARIREADEARIRETQAQAREENAFKMMHRLVEKVRDYRARRFRKVAPASFDRPYWDLTIHQMCEIVLYQYLQPRHGGKISFALKFREGNDIKSIRIGEKDGKNPAKEEIGSCHVFQLYLSPLKDGTAQNFIYVKDLDRPTIEERLILQGKHQGIVGRSTLNGSYKTFVALPIKTGNQGADVSDNIQELLGFIGFDSKIPGSFGDIPEHERQFLSAFVDLISEILEDLPRVA